MTPRGKDLKSAYSAMSDRYRTHPSRAGFASEAEAAAYVAARLPATKAVVERCLTELPADYQPASILDLGAGPGTATLACLERFGQDIPITLVEQDTHIIKLGRELLEEKGQYIQANLLSLDWDTLPQPTFDLVILSYVLNEMAEKKQLAILQEAMNRTTGYLLIIVPGTPHAFEQLRQLRSVAIEQGMTVMAPCPHQLTCPMAGSDWCHFSVRLNRSSQHRQLKGADLGYEDEKFSYLILSKKPVPSNTSRIVKKPLHRGGHGLIDICIDGKIERLNYSKKKNTHYQELRSTQWGDKVLKDLFD